MVSRGILALHKVTREVKLSAELTDITNSGITYKTTKLTISNNFELYFCRCWIQIVSGSLFATVFVIVCTQMNFGALYNALDIHTPKITI